MKRARRFPSDWKRTFAPNAATARVPPPSPTFTQFTPNDGFGARRMSRSCLDPGDGSPVSLTAGSFRAQLTSTLNEALARARNGILPDASEMTDRFEEGMRRRRAVLGDAHVDRAEAQRTALDTPFQTLITEAAWGTVWASEAISLRERSMLTLALLAATGNFEEIPMHIRATARTGATPRDVMEAFQHVAIYAGVPKANRAIAIAKATFAEMETADHA
jgi:4-carboxymuconolactone decarboxylase